MAKKVTCWVLLVLCGLFQLKHTVGQDPTDISPPCFSLDATAVNAGWLQLFDGKSLDGWKPESKADWQVSDEAIVVTQGGKGLLRTTCQFDDFQLCLEYRCDADTNSGIFLRTPPTPRNPANDCYEFNIASADNPFPTGSLVARKKTAQAALVNEGQWRQVHLVCIGGEIRGTIDGKETIHYVDDEFLGRGFIGLQYNQGKIEFRNLHLRPLNLEPLLDSELSLWNRDQALKSTFEVDNELILNVSGGSGQLESKATFGDFAFSMQCRTNAPGLNSGVFFRCIPGELMNGYESQIQNEFLDDDRTQPKDCGTGGIFRRTQAKRVVANDQEWFSKTIITNGSRINVWVNGIQVTDWSDERPANRNPRRGRRTEAGTFILQGHDPTTDIDFRNIKAKELSIRWARDR